MLRNENRQLVGYVFVDVNDKIGIADYVATARQVVAEKADVPPGYRLDWAGQFKYFERAKAKLQMVIALTLFIVFFMLFLNRKSVTESLIILMAVPFSLIGAVWLLYWLDYNLSVARHRLGTVYRVDTLPCHLCHLERLAVANNR